MEARTALGQADAALERRLNQKEERQRSLYIAELNHCVRNILALIRSLSRRAQESSSSLESYAKALEQRIAALGAAHDLAANKIEDGISLKFLFETEAKPYLSDDFPDQLTVTGEDYSLRSGLALIFALVAHELVTNCVKYGALSVPTGSIRIHVADHRHGLTIHWQEDGAPPFSPPTRRGFGLSLIENAMPYELDGDCELEFTQEGLRAAFWIPDEAINKFSGSTPIAKGKTKAVTEQYVGIPKNALVVEDSMVVTMDMADMLKKIGIKDVQTCASEAQATRTLEAATPDVAILDISLRIGKSFSVARTLIEKGVPFCFATGYGSDYETPDDLSDIIVLTKPVDLSSLRTVVMGLKQSPA